FISRDNGNTWVHFSDANPHIHADLHAVYFDPTDSTGNTLYIGSDGGVAKTTNLGTSFSSIYNKHLLNLQFYGNAAGLTQKEDGRSAGGTQDNGNLYCICGAGELPFRATNLGDGGMNQILSTGHLLRDWNTDAEVLSSPWSPFEFRGDQEIPLNVPGN